MGVFINDTYLEVSKENMENYFYIKIIALFSSFIPLTYMWCLVPSLQDTERI